MSQVDKIIFLPMVLNFLIFGGIFYFFIFSKFLPCFYNDLLLKRKEFFSKIWCLFSVMSEVVNIVKIYKIMIKFFINYFFFNKLKNLKLILFFSK